jgi:hypothetical protein
MKKLKKDVFGLTTAGIGMAVGASAISSVGGNTAGLSALSGKMGIMGSMVGTGAVLRTLNTLPHSKKKKGKRY